MTVSFYSAIVPPRPHRRDSPERIAERELTRQISTAELDRQVRRCAERGSFAEGIADES